MTTAICKVCFRAVASCHERLRRGRFRAAPQPKKAGGQFEHLSFLKPDGIGYSAAMSYMELHFLDARGTLSELHGWVRDSLTTTHEKAAAIMQIGPLDVIVQTGKRIIPEKGHLGFAPRPGVVFITLDPNSSALRPNANASLERMFAHELHHAARWDGPGYGSSLGEALVSEGLAGHFVQELFGGPPEPWERLSIDEVNPHVTQASKEWDRGDYNHEAWFFGRGNLPRWLGYSLGFRLIERYQNDNPACRASSMSGANARDFLSTLPSI